VSTIITVPWQRIEVISGPDTSIPSSVSNVMPDDSTMKGNATAGDMGDFATLMNL
jgi:autotransporter translocation and assembly factor TamB